MQVPMHTPGADIFSSAELITFRAILIAIPSAGEGKITKHGFQGWEHLFPKPVGNGLQVERGRMLCTGMCLVTPPLFLRVAGLKGRLFICCKLQHYESLGCQVDSCPSLCLQGRSGKDEQERRLLRLRSLQYLERYIYLILFNAYLHLEKKDSWQRPFSLWMREVGLLFGPKCGAVQCLGRKGACDLIYHSQVGVQCVLDPARCYFLLLGPNVWGCAPSAGKAPISTQYLE